MTTSTVPVLKTKVFYVQHRHGVRRGFLGVTSSAIIALDEKDCVIHERETWCAQRAHKVVSHGLIGGTAAYKPYSAQRGAVKRLGREGS
jgi:hypothetical protein